MFFLKYLSVAVLLLGISERCVQGSKAGSAFQFVDNYVEGFQNQVNSLNAFLEVRSSAQSREEHFWYSESNYPVKEIGKYDFIIVGAGSSGSVIANRLSEIPEWKILLLEAGNVETPATKVPAAHACLKSSSSPYTWGYYSTPQNNSCLDMEDRRCYIPTAKMVGGTTSINDMIYTRGNQRDYDLWADTGLKGWCWDSLFPYFKKIEDAHVESILDHKFHRYGGPIYLESPQYHSEIAASFLEGAKEIGLDEIDVNGKKSLGLGVPHLTTYCGERFSAAKAYLEPAVKRKNLDIRPLSQVIKILISEHTKESRGVEFVSGGQVFAASAAKEVILAGGPINTAKLLLFSGIGPKEELKALKIEPVVDLKVGKHLIDHVAFPGLRYVLNETEEIVPPSFYNKEIDYLRNGKGPMTSSGVDLIGFIKTEYSKGRHSYPDVELLITSDKFQETPINVEVRVDDTKEKITVKGFTVKLVLLHPKSRGSVCLKDSDPLHHPLVDLNALSDHNDEDISTLLSAIRSAQKLINSYPVESLGAYLLENQAPICLTHKFDSDDYWRCAIKHLSVSMGHVTGTAPMGIEKEEHYGDSVVDSELRVHGVERLRVADDSVVPVSISGHLAALKMVIGEKCAEIVKEEWLK